MDSHLTPMASDSLQLPPQPSGHGLSGAGGGAVPSHLLSHPHALPHSLAHAQAEGLGGDTLHPAKWSVPRVLEFVSGLGLDHLKPTFAKNVVDGEQLLVRFRFPLLSSLACRFVYMLGVSFSCTHVCI